MVGPTQTDGLGQNQLRDAEQPPGVTVYIKSSQVVGLRDRVAIIRALLHAISSPPPYAGYGALNSLVRRSADSGIGGVEVFEDRPILKSGEF